MINENNWYHCFRVGLVQSILAAALARAGKSVLHLDRYTIVCVCVCVRILYTGSVTMESSGLV